MKQMHKWLFLLFTFCSMLAEAQTAYPFLPGLVDTHNDERDMCISADGRTIYFTVQDQRSGRSVIFQSEKKDKTWSLPMATSFSGVYNDLEAQLSPDGQTLYFASDRPRNDSTRHGFDIWKVVRVKNAWGTPECLGEEINGDGDEFYPSVNKKGDVYFTSQRKDGLGKEDILVSRLENGKYQPPVSLDSTINSPGYEFNAYVTPDDNMIIFTGYGRKDDMGKGDLYVSKKDSSGKWLPAVHLPYPYNSDKLDYCPYIDASGHFYFTSMRNIFNTQPVIKNRKEWNAHFEQAGAGHSDIYQIRNTDWKKTLEEIFPR